MAKKSTEGSAETIVVGMDFSPSSNRAFAFSVNLAKKLNGILIAVFVKNYDDLALAIRQEIRGVNLRDKKLLAKEVDHYIQEQFQSICKIHGKDYSRVRLAVVSGKPWREILKVARSAKATMISVGTRSRSQLTGLILGSTAVKLVQNSFCPVTIVRANTRRHSA